MSAWLACLVYSSILLSAESMGDEYMDHTQVLSLPKHLLTL